MTDIHIATITGMQPRIRTIDDTARILFQLRFKVDDRQRILEIDADDYPLLYNVFHSCDYEDEHPSATCNPWRLIEGRSCYLADNHDDTWTARNLHDEDASLNLRATHAKGSKWRDR